MAYLLVGLGGLMGAITRYQFSRWFAADGSVARLTGLALYGFPLATLLVNVIGSFFIGILGCWGASSAGGGIPDTARWFFVSGFLGAFTTFSAFSLETIVMLQDGSVMRAAINVLLNVILCLIAAGLGCLWVSQTIA